MSAHEDSPTPARPADDAPVENNEILYRRVSVKSQHANLENGIAPQAFLPTKNADKDGISFSRDDKYNSPEEAAAQGEVGKEFYLIVVPVAALRAAGFTVDPLPVLGRPGHAVVRELTSVVRAKNKDRMDELMLELKKVAEADLKILGPFSGRTAKETATNSPPPIPDNSSPAGS